MTTAVSVPTVHIIDDDEAVLDSLSLLLETVGVPHKGYLNAQVFLEEFAGDSFDRVNGCVVLDVRMPFISGIECQQKLSEMGSKLPIIFVTGYADVPMAVEAMKNGAIDFIEKPFREQTLLDAINRALQSSVAQQKSQNDLLQIEKRVESLTERELQVLKKIVEGKANKVIAIELHLSQRTVEIHRAKVMEKMQADSLAHLIKMTLQSQQK